MAGSLDDFRKPLNMEPFVRRWVAATQRRNLDSLSRAQGPGGPLLAGNKPYTVRRKKHGRVGFDTGEMAAGLLAPNAVNLKIGGASVEATVFAGPGGTDKKVNIFVKGQRAQPGWMSALTKSGKRKAWKTTRPPVPGRDFIGISEADVDAAAGDMLADVARQFGFRSDG